MALRNSQRAVDQNRAQAHLSRLALARALREVTYEVLPFRSTEQKVLAHVPTDTALTVTTTEAKGLAPTVDLAIALTGHGYRVAPHLAARQVRDRSELTDIVERLRDSGVKRAFIIGGDARDSGTYPDALSLLRELAEIGHPFIEIGIGGYPEGHGSIPAEQLEAALDAKQEYASSIISQLCFDPASTMAWARDIRRRGVRTPVRIGIPGPISRQKLIRVSAGLGLGQSARFLTKQQSMFWRFFTPGGYSPDKLINGLASALAEDDTNLTGFHVFTFNDLEDTEAWRRRRLAVLG